MREFSGLGAFGEFLDTLVGVMTANVIALDKATKLVQKTAKAKTAPEPAAEPAPPAPLEEEHFRVFELTYGSGATLVLSARAAGAADQRKYVTLIAQPDFYGNLVVLHKSVTEAARNFSDLISRVHFRGESALLLKGGKPS